MFVFCFSVGGGGSASTRQHERGGVDEAEDEISEFHGREASDADFGYHQLSNTHEKPVHRGNIS